MDNNSGDFSKNLFSLQLQLKTLLDGAGGDDATELLDNLSKLNKSERKLALNIINKTLKRLLESEERLETEEDLEEKTFEESLYQDIVNAFGCKFRLGRSKQSLSVVDGGKAKKKELKKKEKKRIFDFEQFRALRGSTDKTIIN